MKSPYLSLLALQIGALCVLKQTYLTHAGGKLFEKIVSLIVY